MDAGIGPSVGPSGLGIQKADSDKSSINIPSYKPGYIDTEAGKNKPKKAMQVFNTQMTGSQGEFEFSSPKFNSKHNATLQTPQGGNWEVSPSLVQRSGNATIVEILKYLKEIEYGIAKIDKYVEYCIRKYKHFQFNIKLFLKDELIGKCQYIE